VREVAGKLRAERAVGTRDELNAALNTRTAAAVRCLRAARVPAG
jgi:hypothetical protein